MEKKHQITKIEYPEHDMVVLTSSNGDTYTSKSESFMDFLHDIEIPTTKQSKGQSAEEIVEKWADLLLSNSEGVAFEATKELLVKDIESYSTTNVPTEGECFEEYCEAEGILRGETIFTYANMIGIAKWALSRISEEEKKKEEKEFFDTMPTPPQDRQIREGHEPPLPPNPKQ